MIRTTATSVARTASRSLTARRQLSSVPKQHKAKDYWNDLKAKRPIDEDDQHLVFHPPYNKGTIVTLMVTVIGLGVGTMYFGYAHQQYKQGYWK